MSDLRELGLSSYEDRAYRALVGLGTATASEIAERSGVPEGRIYDVLETLASAGMARVQRDTRPKRYAAVDPAVGVERLVDARTDDLRAEIDRTERIGQEVVDTLGETAGSDRFRTTAIGPEESLELLFERIDAATDRIAVVASAFAPTLDVAAIVPDALDHLGDALDRGVTIDLLASDQLVATAPETVVERIQTGPFASEAFDLRTVPELAGDLFIVDHVEVCFEVVNPIDPDAVVGLIDLQDPAFAFELEDQFDAEWERARRIRSRDYRSAGDADSEGSWEDNSTQ